MKKIILLSLFVIFVSQIYSQIAVSISGTVTNINGGTPVANHLVFIQIDTLISPNTYTEVYTNPNGFYTATIPLNPSTTTGALTVSTYDCQNYLWSYNLTFTAGGGATLVQNFVICASANNCVADYAYNMIGYLSKQFVDLSTGGNGGWSWNFGDGSAPVYEQYPQHTFPAAGAYNVTLTYGVSGSSCWDQETKTVMVGDTIPNTCYANFTYQGTPNNTGYLVQYYDQSVSQTSISWNWSFGDPASGINNTSTLQNPSHTYPLLSYPETYLTCLTIVSSDSSCYDQICYQITVYPQQSCNAEFEASPVLGAYNTLHFEDQSTGNISVWTWDFGDGTTQSISFPQNPNIIHSYAAPGLYSACLYIQGPDSCFDTHCENVQVGDSLMGCQAYFTYSIDSLTGSNILHFTDLSSGFPTQWQWDFGDGTTSNQQNPTHQFNVTGPYSTFLVCLHITGNNNTCNDTYCMTIIVTANSGCHANFIYASVPGAAPNVIQFTDESVANGPVSWFWNFDDGTTSTEQNPVHTFPANPIDPFFVCLTITGTDSSCVDTYCLPVYFEAQNCVADFEAVPSPNANLTMHFIDHSEGANLWLWTWNFGDGDSLVIVSPNNPNVAHTYQAPGFYTVCLTIQGDFGNCNSTYCQTIAVGDSVPGCQAQFSYFPDSVSLSLHTIQFIDLSTGNPNQWFWNFGDGTSSSLQNPEHTFAGPGTYHVCLTIYGTACQSAWCADVEIGANINCANYFTYSSIGLSVNFEGHLVNGEQANYVWDFGDNQSAVGSNVIHTYSTPGVYYVTLTSTTLNPVNACTYTSSQMITLGDTVLWNQIYGQVFEGSFPVMQGMVMLFSVDTSNFFVPYVDVSTLDSAGVYYFSMVPQGNFYIYAIPFDSDYLPTYYGDVLFWESATIVSLGTATNPYNINLVPAGTCGQGNGTIQGQFNQGDVSQSLIDKVTMLLKNESLETVRYSQVGSDGSFNLSGLALGTYYLYAELAGCTSQTIKVVLDGSNPTVEVMLTLTGNSILGDDEPLTSLEAVAVYPNPVKDQARVVVSASSQTDLVVELFNSSGQKVYKSLEKGVTQGSIITIPVSTLSSGIYMLKLTTEDGKTLTSKLVKSN